MSLYDYRMSANIIRDDPPFDALIMAAMRKADTVNGCKLAAGWPDLANELGSRYNAPGGLLPGEVGA